MEITLNIDDEIAEKVHKIAADKNTTLTAMVREYLNSVAGAVTPEMDAAPDEETSERVRDIVASLTGREASTGTEAGREAAAKFLETVRQFSRPMGLRNWTRDDLYGSPAAFSGHEQQVLSSELEGRPHLKPTPGGREDLQPTTSLITGFSLGGITKQSPTGWEVRT